MSKTIRVSDNVYTRLQVLQGPRETYSEVIERSITIVEEFKGISDRLGPSPYLQERPKEEVKQ